MDFYYCYFSSASVLELLHNAPASRINFRIIAVLREVTVLTTCMALCKSSSNYLVLLLVYAISGFCLVNTLWNLIDDYPVLVSSKDLYPVLV